MRFINTKMTAVARVSFSELIDLFFINGSPDKEYCPECSNIGDCMICSGETKYMSKFNNDLIYNNKIEALFSILDNKPAGFKLAIGEPMTPSRVNNCNTCMEELKEKTVKNIDDLKISLVVPMVTNDPRKLHMVNQQKIRLFDPFLIKNELCQHLKLSTIYQFYDWNYLPDRPKDGDLVIYDNHVFFYQENENFDHCNLYENLNDIGKYKPTIITRQKDIIPFNMT